MAANLTHIIAHARRIIPELPATRAFELAKIVHGELFAFIPEMARVEAGTPATVSVSANTKEYAFPTGVRQIDYAALGSKRLFETTVETLNQRDPTWRNQAARPTQQFYTTSDADGNPVIGLHPTPDSSGTLTVYGSFAQTLTQSTSLGGSLHSEMPYVAGIVALAALEYRPALAAQYQQFYQAQVEIARNFARTSNEGVKDSSIPNSRNEPQSKS